MIVRDTQNKIGFIFPYDVAVEYRNLRAVLYPEAKQESLDLRNLATQQDSLIGNLRQQVSRFEMIDRNSRIAIDSLQTRLTECDAAVDKLSTQVRLYKTLTAITTPAALVAILVAVLK